MNKFLFIISVSCLFLVVSCKPKQQIAKQNITEESNNIDTKKENFQYDYLDFSTLMTKADISFELEGVSSSYVFDIRINKDSIIWLSAPLGLAKLRLTHDDLSFYSKLSRIYFKASYEELSEWIGINVNFYTVQSLLLGTVAVNTEDNRAAVLVSDYEEKSYVQYKLPMELLVGMFVYDNDNNRVLEQSYKKQKQDIYMHIEYEYENIKQKLLPTYVNLLIERITDTHEFDIRYSTFQLNKSIRFPFEIPEGYTQIFLN